ncbi:hypothetical protein ACFU96_21805 [Streptomyces sp. NPDC057620]|uniref:hypothetical protein n=1 Tax=Streptomyces sp. NPDC057620 TaxID=3346185 RepID=UPI0036A46E59
MGFNASISNVNIKFDEDHKYHGAEARLRGMAFGEYTAATGLDGGDGEDVVASMKRFADNLLSWNLEDDQGRAVPATPEGLRTVDQGVARALQNAYIDALVGVHDADPLPESSTSGEPSLVESIPMEALSPSLAS